DNEEEGAAKSERVSDVRKRLLVKAFIWLVKLNSRGREGGDKNIRVIPHIIHNDDGNPTSANIKQALRQVTSAMLYESYL
ncbi:hypothetical protein Tco_1364737, partial [Tanacetum coccineum]